MTVVVRVRKHRSQSINDRNYKALAVYFTGYLSRATVQLMKQLKIPNLRRSLVLTVVIPSYVGDSGKLCTIQHCRIKDHQLFRGRQCPLLKMPLAFNTEITSEDSVAL